jgi:Family of unknown function (DUF5927)/Core-2/I-Branching enzyme
MTLGVVMLVHTALDRAEQVIRHWVAAGCPVVVHVDRAVDRRTYDAFAAAVSDLDQVRFSYRYRCEWGTWGIVQGSQAASELMLASFPDVRHIILASGSCLPLRPVADLRAYLDARPQTDFIESATTADVPWTVGGLSAERFTLRFPFSWRRQRRLFDWYVGFQRRWGLRRRIPGGITPHMGSQWWCLTELDRYFRRVWIPDESYFQTLARLYAQRIESRSLTLSKFDFQGKPHIFYDDHLQLLRRSDCFIARKIWPKADALYQAFLDPALPSQPGIEPNPGKIDRIFAKATDRRTRGRPGLTMQSRFPNAGWENGLTSAPFAVFQGFADLFQDFAPWLARMTGTRVHGHLFDRSRVQFEGDQPAFTGALADSAMIRDANPQAFLRSLIWNTRGERQSFQFGPADAQAIAPILVQDPNAQIRVITGAWAVPLFLSNRNFADIRADAAQLQRVETAYLDLLRSPRAKARSQIWSMSDFVENPMDCLQEALDGIGGPGMRHPAEAPVLVDLTGFGQFLQNLKNQGMHPYLVGDFPIGPAPGQTQPPKRKPYLVR